MESYKNEKLNILTQQTNKPNSIPHTYFEQFQKVLNFHTSLFFWKAPE